MAEKPTKKTVTLSIRRERRDAPKIIVTTGFKLRFDKPSGLLDVYLEGRAQQGERISVDWGLMRLNLDTLRKYAAGLTVDEDDAAQKEDVAVSEQASFANVLHFSHMGLRAETIFGVFSIADWAEASRGSEGSKPPEVRGFDNLVAISTLGVQKKLLLEMLLLMSQQGKE